MLGTDLLEEYLDAYDLELELEVEQRLGHLAARCSDLSVLRFSSGL